MQIGFFVAYLVVAVVILVKSILTDLKCRKMDLICRGMYLTILALLDTIPEETREEMIKYLDNMKESAEKRQADRSGGAK